MTCTPGWKNDYEWLFYTYAVHVQAGSGTWGKWKEMKRHSETLLFCDTGHQTGMYYRVNRYSLQAKNDPPILTERHFQGLDLVFCDGHVEWHEGRMPLPLPIDPDAWPWFENQF